MKILLAGDSWTYGPVSIEDHLISLGNEVTNITCPGQSNSFVINELKSQLLSKTFDKIVYVQTEPLRDNKYAKSNTGWQDLVQDKKWFDDHLHLLSIQQDILDETYKILNDIDLPIYLLGGCSKIDTELLSKYSNLTCIMPSIPEFLQPGYTHPTIFGVSEWQKRIDDKWDLDTIDYILDQIKSTEWLHGNCSYFFNDPWHPDILGYRIVAEHISKYFKT